LSTLYIRLPSHAVAESLQPGIPLYCEFASVSNAGTIEREGMAALPDMGETVSRAQRVVLLLAASDVTLLRVKVPPISASKLKAALPNLVEDQLMSDPAECVVVADDSRGDTRTVAIVQRNWLELLSKTLVSLGARNVAAVPSQLCLPLLPDAVSAAVIEQSADVEVAVRLSEHEGLGLAIVADQPESAAFDTLQSIAAVVPADSRVALHVPQARIHDYQDSLQIAPALNERFSLHTDNWDQWVAGASRNSINLMTGLRMAAGPRMDWRPWRWPIILAVAVLLINIIGLNVEWLRLRREAEALRGAMVQSYRAAFPKDPVVVDPLAQLRQKMATAQRESGEIALDDFLALTAGFAEAWSNVGQGKGAIAGLEYRDGSLIVKPKQGTNVTMEQLSGALTARNLSVSQASAGTWQIRRAK
jgi:general secretion pathway protein L